MTASGLSGRRLRSLRRRTASPSVASQARWKPPRPLTARISPAPSSSAAARMGPAGSPSAPAASSTSSPAPAPGPRQPQQAYPRPADRARVGLGVEAPVGRVLVLAAARGTEGEASHGRALAVVGQPLDDREPGPAVGAVGEGVVVAAVRGVEQLAAAVVAGRDVGGDQLVGVRVGLALEDDERVAGLRAVRGRAGRHRAHLVRGDVAAGRRLPRQRLAERGDRVRRALHEHLHAGGRVQHPPAQAVAHGEGVHERAEADALDHATDADARRGQRLPAHSGQRNWKSSL